MESTEQKLNRIIESMRIIQAENWALKNFVMAIYAQGNDINKTMNHFIRSCEETDTHNTYSTLPEDFVSNFQTVWKEMVSLASLELSRAPQFREKK